MDLNAIDRKLSLTQKRSSYLTFFVSFGVIYWISADAQAWNAAISEVTTFDEYTCVVATVTILLLALRAGWYFFRWYRRQRIVMVELPPSWSCVVPIPYNAPTDNSMLC